MKKTAIIVGGGIGGLFTGALLAKNGIQVTVLEKNDIIGGGLQCFHRKGKIYETGMHVMGGFTEGGNLSKICRYLGILDSLKLHHIDSDCMDEVRYGATGEVYRIASGPEAFVTRLSEYFPHEAEGLKAYVDCIYALTREMPLFYLQESPHGLPIHSEKFSWATNRLISHFISDEKLQYLLAYLNPLYGGVWDHTPAYVHALLNVLYINGSCRFVGGSQQLADALRDVIRQGGGEVLSRAEVAHIEVQNREVLWVETKSGERYSADYCISSVHPTELFRLLPKDAFRKSFVTRLNDIPQSYSAFSVFIDFKENSFPYIPHTCYYMNDYADTWTQAEFEPDSWPGGFMYMTPPENVQGKWAARMLVHCVMSYEQVRRWENTTVGRRGADYEAWKMTCADKVIAKLEGIYPDIRQQIAGVYASSPLTVRDYYHTRDGAIFGNIQDCSQPLMSQLSVRTKIKNLFLTGQNVNLHGICGVPLTAISTAEAILGHNRIIDQLKHADSHN